MIRFSSDLRPLLDAARQLANSGERRILGLTGAPGAGKSMLAEILGTELANRAVVVGMDGFHLRNDELRRRGSLERKGAIDTFDVGGYLNLLRRLRSCEPGVYAPIFDRALEESIGSAVPVPDDVSLIITEGNYLLAEAAPWDQILPLLDECWFVEPDEATRLERLVARHVAFGRTPDEAYARSTGPDGRNADLVAGTRHRADRIVRLPPLEHVPISTSDPR